MKYQIKEHDKMTAESLKRALVYASTAITNWAIEFGFSPSTVHAVDAPLRKAIKAVGAGAIDADDYDIIEDVVGVYYRRRKEDLTGQINIREIRADYDECMLFLSRVCEEMGGWSE